MARFAVSLSNRAGGLGFCLAETARGEAFVAVFDGYLCMLSVVPAPNTHLLWRWSIESGGGLTLRGPSDACIVHAEGVAETASGAERQLLEWLEGNAQPPGQVSLCNPSPEEVREVRKRLNLTQREAAQVTSVTEGKSYRSWQNFETPAGMKNHRQIPRGTWELFLLLTNQHPHYSLVSRADFLQSIDLPGRQSLKNGDQS